ncbi:MAG: hypothetical protein KDK70_35335, partial [Myxococcales bacterium]|nr:hypothetical protein [Myxococcales bacterium]
TARLVCLSARPAQPERARALDEVHAALLPRGLSIVNASYLAEAGNAVRVEALLRAEPAHAELLASVPVHDGEDLLGLTRRWLAAGAALGELERERDVLAAERVTQAVGPASIAAARSRWLRLVSQVLSILALGEVDPEVLETLRGPILRASERAGQRYPSRGAKAATKAASGAATKAATGAATEPAIGAATEPATAGATPLTARAPPEPSLAGRGAMTPH